MAIYHPPTPAVFLGGRQPYEPRPRLREEEGQPINNPPFMYGGPYAEVYETASIAQPNPWTYTFMGGWQPFMSGRLSLEITAVPEDDPPFSQLERTQEYTALIASMAQPDPWVYAFFNGMGPFVPLKLSPGIPGQSVERPPSVTQNRRQVQMAITYTIAQPDPWTFSFTGGRGPFMQRLLNPTVTNVVVNNPPFDMRNRAQLVSILALWNQPFPPIPVGLEYIIVGHREYTQGYILGM